MKTHKEIQQIAVGILKEESRSILNLASLIDDDFSRCVELIFKSKGRVIVTGIGKSAIIANKIVSTLNSTGTPAVFMHAADAIHGDLGIILGDDIVICLSRSGNTPEIKVLVPLIKNLGNTLVALVGNTGSFLAKEADIILKAVVDKEVCPNNLAPTSSTTAQLVIGDALAVCLIECRGFTSDDFAKFHPGGSLGKKLYTRVCDIFLNNRKPVVKPDDPISKVIVEISSSLLGATAVIDDNQKLAGVITDGDIRRMLEKFDDLKNIHAKDIMNKNPKTIQKDELAVNAFNLMEKNKITQLIVMENLEYAGIIHLHNILQEGII